MARNLTRSSSGVRSSSASSSTRSLKSSQDSSRFVYSSGESRLGCFGGCGDGFHALTVSSPGSMCRIVIWLLRHGDAADGSPDAERPLTARASEQARAAGAALAALGVALTPASPARRCAPPRPRGWPARRSGSSRRSSAGSPAARSTAEALAAGLGEHVLLVGHDPDFSMAVHALTGAQVRMKKGGLAGVDRGELHGAPAPGRAERGIAG